MSRIIVALAASVQNFFGIGLLRERVMENRRSRKNANHAAKGEQVTKQFVRIYYGILNSHPEQLFQFYGDKSTVIVSEFGTGAPSPFTESADSREAIRHLLKKVFSGVSCKIKTALPQFTVDGGVLLLVSGTLTKAASSSKVKQDADEHCFTQALVLAPQKNGYYILNDTLHIMGSLANIDAALGQGEIEESTGHTGRFYPSVNGSNSMMPVTPRPKRSALSPTRGKHRSMSSDGDMGTREIKTDPDSDSDASSDGSSKPMRTPQAKHHSAQLKPRKPFRAVPAAPGGPHSNGIPLQVSVGVVPPQSAPGQSKPPVNGSDPRAMNVPVGHGVFIARLPFGIQADEVERAFSVFGPVLNGADGIQVRDGRNGCYAFVTFESCASAKAAIDKGAIVQGKKVFVEPRYQRSETADPTYGVTNAAQLSQPQPLPAPPQMPIRHASPITVPPQRVPN